jgi:orotate phosphoribosyltransferase
MQSNPVIARHLVECGGYKDLDEPVILASGELGVYFVNAEKLSRDPKINDTLKAVGDNSNSAVTHFLRMMEEHPEFREDIGIIAEHVNEIFERSTGFNSYVVAGGQRRDWVFSGPVAKVLGVPHVSLYKTPTGGGLEAINIDGTVSVYPGFNNVLAVHVADLLTKASSCCKEPNGWVPQERRAGITVRNLDAVVTRLQGGEQNLAAIGVDTFTYVAIDEDFLRAHSGEKYLERNLAYQRDTTAWSQEYLRRNGALRFVGDFDPKGGRLDKALAFMERYGKYLVGICAIQELEAAVQDKYGQPINEILAGVKPKAEE